MAEREVVVNLGDRQVTFDIRTLDGLKLLAECIEKLQIPEKNKVHVEKMRSCKKGEYSKAFYEAAVQIMTLLNEKYSLEDAVATIAEEIPPVSDIPYALKWGSAYAITRQQLIEHAQKIRNNKEFTGIDSNLAKRILSKKATTDEWKHYALRFADVEARLADDESNFWDFFKDDARAVMEVAELKKNIRKVTIVGDEYEFPRPHHPPWHDVGIWYEDYYGKGFGDMFRPEMEDSEDDEESSWATDEENDNTAHNVDNSAPEVAATPLVPSLPADKAPLPVKASSSVLPNALSSNPLPPAEWPALPNKLNMVDPSAQPTSNSVPMQVQRSAWSTGQKKKFMNSGIAKGRRKLNYAPPESAEIDYVIDVEKAYSITDVWGFSLLGQYVGRHPGHRAIKAMMDQWGVKSKYKIEEGWMIFSFDSEEDQEKVLIEGPYMIHGRPMILKNVPDKFAFTNEDFATVPLWMRIYGLGSRFWTDEFLGGIASYVGKPLYLDPVTDSRKRNSYARVLVEVNLAEPVIRKVPIKFTDGDAFTCRIQLENEPKFCKQCCVFGHNMGGCSFLRKDTVMRKEAGQVSTNLQHVMDSAHQQLHVPGLAIPAAAQIHVQKPVDLRQDNTVKPAAMDQNKADKLLNSAAATSVLQSSGTDAQQLLQIAENEGNVMISGDYVAGIACPIVVGKNRFDALAQDGGLMEDGDVQKQEKRATTDAMKGPLAVLHVDGNDLVPLTGKGQQHKSLADVDGEHSRAHAPPNLPHSTVNSTRASGRKKGA